MLYIMSASGRWAWAHPGHSRLHDHPKIANKSLKHVDGTNQNVYSNLIQQDDLLRRLAVPQLVLAVITLTSYHVQIITRLSSGYPVWYWWLANLIIEDHSASPLIQTRRKKLGLFLVKWMIMYAVIQGGLFASFLPPA